MLVSKTQAPKTGDVVALKLLTGEEIVGKLVDTPVGGVTLSKPIVIQLQMVSPGQAAIGFAPFMMAREEDGDFTFNAHAVAVQPAKAREDIRASYIKATTGLEIPAQGPSSILKA